ncbi:hypothetical protein BDN67DRAFT_972533 [Paxillus ammoniavirescens]|nr:hypothetical protein BDN67DRAFT_972533 [Paxillus ammoniavirescens]
MTSAHTCFRSLRGEIFHIVAIVFTIVIVFVVLTAGLLPRLVEARDERPRAPTGRAHRPRRRRLRADQNVVSGASSRRNIGPST